MVTKTHAARNLPTDSLPGRDRQRHQKLDRAAAALFGPKPHADGRDKHQEEPRMELEERVRSA